VILKRSDATDALLDARAFLRLERWYAERGIPYRRGYLLHGPPGGGKTSLVRAIAGELRLPVYQASLGGRGLDDEAFHRLLRACARRAVVLLEDVDAASGAAVGARSGGGEEDGGGGGLTLPGLLSALDGVGAADGRLLFMTCRDASALEPALVRPGRIDVRIEFGPPDRAQAAALFRHFYGASDRAAATAAAAAASSSSCSSADRGDRSDASAAGGTASKPSPSPVAFGGAPPLFDARVVDALAEKFGAAAVASGETRGRRRRGGGGGDEKAAARPPPLSMAALQGHLMMYREDPEGAVDAIGGIEWGCD
jgi:chaperone BCS1